ncbi:MAG: transposase, partial [Cyanobacteria bacterium J06554_3]
SVHLVTHVMTTHARSHEAQCIEGIHDALIAKQLQPAEHYVDAAYVDALLLASEQLKGIETVGPARVDPSWQSRTEGAYSTDQFKIDWENKQVICPQGKVSREWKAHTRTNGDPYLYARFRLKDCAACQAVDLCTKAAAGYRSLSLLPRPAHEALAKARAQQRTKAGQKRYRRRAGIEGTISQGVRSCGLRRSRYIGQAKTHLQNVAVGAALNIDRLFNWFQGVPLAKTRISHFSALKVV